MIIDDDADQAQRRMDELEAANGITDMGPVPHLAGPPGVVADAIRPYRDLGFGTIIVRMPAPYDPQTIERIGEVTELLDR